MNYDVILIRYGEIGLKSDWVRRSFEDRLMENIRSGLEQRSVEGEVERGYGRVFVHTKEVEAASDVLERVFGIVSLSPAIKIETDLEKMKEVAGDLAEEKIKENETFAVRARRTGQHAFSSKDVEEQVGAEILERMNREVDLDNPDKTIFLEVRQNRCYIFGEKIDGPGGLPLGTQGKVVSLFNGDCNSFLATWLMMKRGCEPILLYGNTSPYREDGGRMEQSLEILKSWSYGADLEVKNFDLGSRIFNFEENTEEKINCLLCKRFLYRVAERLAEDENAKAIISGEAGNKPDNDFDLYRIQDLAVEMPVIRPLIGFNRKEIRDRCREISEDLEMKKMDCKGKEKNRKSEERIEEIEKDLGAEEAVESLDI
ncbi:MAG: tRNA sulfurtransferase [Candidatus Aenigmatarchaeota archaeon]